MKLAFSSNAFKKYSLEYSIKAIAAIGYEGVELLCDIPHAYPPDFGEKRIQSVRNLLSSHSLQISNLNAFTLYAIGDVYHPSWIEESEKLRELRIKHTIDCLHLANKVGVKFTLIIGQQELQEGTVLIRDMEAGVQEYMPQNKIVREMKKRYKAMLEEQELGWFVQGKRAYSIRSYIRVHSFRKNRSKNRVPCNDRNPDTSY